MVTMQIAALLLAVSAGGDTVLLDFSAPWCGPCRLMESVVDDLQHAGYPVRKVNFDHEQKLAGQYNVTHIPCFVLLVDGKESGRITGATSRSDLVSLFSKAHVRPKDSTTQIARAQSPDPPARAANQRAASTPSPIPGVSLPPTMTGSPLPTSRVSSAEIGRESTWTASRTAAAKADSQALVAASVRLTVDDPAGSSHGTGTIIDSRQGDALVLTCGHLFRDCQGKGNISVELCDPQSPKRLKGQLVSYDLKNDVALVSIQPKAPVRVAPVAPRGYRVAKGDKVTSVGCDHGHEATALESRITGIDKFLGPANFEVKGQPVQGRSGGGLFNESGRVIGVCNAADPADDEGLYAALSVIQSHLDQAGMTAVYESPSGGTAIAAAQIDRASGPARTAAEPMAARGVSLAGGTSLGGGNSQLSDAERALLAQLDQRANGAEVICIVRSLAEPASKSEVIKLDRASPAFLRQLAADCEAQESRHLTSLNVRPNERPATAPLPSVRR